MTSPSVCMRSVTKSTSRGDTTPSSLPRTDPVSVTHTALKSANGCASSTLRTVSLACGGITRSAGAWACVSFTCGSGVGAGALDGASRRGASALDGVWRWGASALDGAWHRGACA
eukprot:358640-Chlamydomonas_euryale.AAC.4